jgi:hypothetical protein
MFPIAITVAVRVGLMPTAGVRAARPGSGGASSVRAALAATLRAPSVARNRGSYRAADRGRRLDAVGAVHGPDRAPRDRASIVARHLQHGGAGRVGQLEIETHRSVLVLGSLGRGVFARWTQGGHWFVSTGCTSPRIVAAPPDASKTTSRSPPRETSAVAGDDSQPRRSRDPFPSYSAIGGNFRRAGMRAHRHLRIGCRHKGARFRRLAAPRRVWRNDWRKSSPVDDRIGARRWAKRIVPRIRGSWVVCRERCGNDGQ